MAEQEPKPSFFEVVHRKKRGQPTQLHNTEYYVIKGGEVAHFASNLISDILPVAVVVHMSDAATRQEMYLSERGVHQKANETQLQAAILVLNYIFSDREHNFVRTVHPDNHNVSWSKKSESGYLFDLENFYGFFLSLDDGLIPVDTLTTDILNEVEQKLLMLKERFQGQKGIKAITDALAGHTIQDVLYTNQDNYEENDPLFPKGLSNDEWVQRFQEVLVRRIKSNLERIYNVREGKDIK